MSYTNEITDLARQELSERRSHAEEENNQHIEEIRQKYPDIYEREMKVKMTVLELIRGAITQKSGQRELIDEIGRQREESVEYVRRRLKECGYPEDYLDVHYTCRKCRDTGSVEGINCSCFRSLLKQYASKALSESRGDLKNFDSARSDIYETAELAAYMGKLTDFLKRYCAEFEHSERRSMLFYGSTGTGKTFLSSCVAREIAQQGFAVSFGTAYEFFKSAEDQRFKNAPGDTETTLIECDLLIIDDLGSEFKTSFTESVLYNILNTRMERGRATIVSTNLSLDELNARYNDRISSRLTGVFLPVRFSGSDVRLRLQKEDAYN
ncbi:MAG: ATP-binding protein [Ruminococcus sp.]|nr:ATP-binding protein [Ruminococcus sp.]